MAAILYYLIIKPLSFLPLGVLYIFSDFLYIIVFKVVGYRKEVVVNNLRNSFPEATPAEINAITKKFYRHFSDLMVESLKLFSISKEEAKRRCKIINPEVVNKLYAEGKNIIIVGGHYNNWEMLALSLNMQIDHQIVGIYTPLTNAFFNKKFAESRTKYGTGIIPKKAVPKYFSEPELPLKATVFGADQSPQFVNPKTYWTTFMNQDTPVMFGTEKYAVENDLPVVFVTITKKKRGYYEMEFSLLEESPVTSAYCSITERHTRFLEEQILREPAYYLWTHKRWKHKRASTLPEQPVALE